MPRKNKTFKYPKDSSFSVRKGETTPRGKPTWPNCLMVKMPREDALSLIASLAHQLKGMEVEVHAFLVGQMEVGID